VTTDPPAPPSLAQIDAFLAAAEDGDVARLEGLAARQPALIDARGNHGLTALAVASERGLLAAVQWLVGRGADRTDALLFAAQGGALEVVKYLVETGSDPDGPGKEGTPSALVCATCFEERHDEVARYLIARGATIDLFAAVGLGDHARIRRMAEATPGILDGAPSPLGGQPGHGDRPLHLAIQRRRDAATALLLLELGADAGAQAAFGLTPLTMAVSAGLEEVTARLRRDPGPRTPLELLALERHDDVRARLGPGGQLDLAQVRRYELLHGAAAAGLAGGIGFLVAELRLPPDLPGPSYFGDAAPQTALVHAVMGGHRAVVEALLQAGADPNADQGANMTALHLAAMCGDLEILRLLAARGGDLDRRDDRNGATPLEWARHNRQAEAAKLLEALGQARA